MTDAIKFGAVALHIYRQIKGVGERAAENRKRRGTAASSQRYDGEQRDIRMRTASERESDGLGQSLLSTFRFHWPRFVVQGSLTLTPAPLTPHTPLCVCVCVCRCVARANGRERNEHNAQRLVSATHFGRSKTSSPCRPEIGLRRRPGPPHLPPTLCSAHEKFRRTSLHLNKPQVYVPDCCCRIETTTKPKLFT